MNNKSKLQLDYEGLIPTIKKLSLAAQFISGSTAAFGIYIVILQKLPITVKFVAILITLLLTIIIIGSFEGGIRKIFPYWVRQIFHWLFDKSKEDSKPKSVRVVLFTMLCILLVPLVLGTTVASWKASPDLVEFSAPTPLVADLNIISQELDGKTTDILNQFEKDIQREKEAFTAYISAEKSTWQAKIDAKKAERKKYLRLDKTKHTWAPGSAALIQNKTIPNLKTDMEMAIQKLHAQQVVKLDSIQAIKNNLLISRQQDQSKILTSTQNQNATTIHKAQSNVNKWGEFLAVLAIIATFFTLFCFTFIEAYKAGIYKDTVQKPRPNGVQVNGAPVHKPIPAKSHVEVAPNTHNKPMPPTVNTQKINHEFVSIDNLIKRTRMQWKRGLDETKTVVSRENNRRKAVENMAFLRSIGVEVDIDGERLIVHQKILS
jgi:hypothetical protein